MRFLDKMRWIRVLSFATIYFFVYATSVVYFAIKSLPPTPEYSWYFQDPWSALSTLFGFILFELPRSPILMLALLMIIFQSSVLGFITEWGLRVLVGYAQLRRGDGKRES